MARDPVLEPTVAEKVCPGALCNGKVKAAGEFSRNPRQVDGLNHHCKECRKSERKDRDRRKAKVIPVLEQMRNEIQSVDQMGDAIHGMAKGAFCRRMMTLIRQLETETTKAVVHGTG